MHRLQHWFPQARRHGKIHTKVEPLSTHVLCSLLIPIKKISLSMEQTTKPVPTLSDKQFVVTKSSLTSAEEHAQRELFWYREELFRTVHGEWKEVCRLSRFNMGSLTISVYRAVEHVKVVCPSVSRGCLCVCSRHYDLRLRGCRCRLCLAMKGTQANRLPVIKQARGFCLLRTSSSVCVSKSPTFPVSKNRV